MRYLKQRSSGNLFCWTPELAARSDMVEVATPTTPLPPDPSAGVLTIRPGYDADEPARVDTSDTGEDLDPRPVVQPVRRRTPAAGGAVAAMLAPTPVPAPAPVLEVDTTGDGF